MAEYYKQRSTFGLIITEGTAPAHVGKAYPGIPGIYTESQVAGWKKVTQAVHESGSRIFLQLMHSGRISHKKITGLDPISAKDFMQKVREKSALVELDSKLASRAVNEGFSGGEKKRNEIFQMAMLEPKLAILDETDSGLDIDALRIVANGVNKLKSPENACIVITHYQRLLDYIVPDFVHVLYNGRIVKSGPKELALELEEKGYDWIKEEVDSVNA
jgi:Fe-S cluster assembly ATP-binding protein